MQRDNPLMSGQTRSDSPTPPTFSSVFGKGKTNNTEDLEMNAGNDPPAKGTVSHTVSNYFGFKDNSQNTNKAPSIKDRKVPTKIEPKVFFSNERTFLSWLNMAVTLSTISLAVVA